ADRVLHPLGGEADIGEPPHPPPLEDREGDRIYLRPVPVGVFTIKNTIGEDDSRLRVLVAAGTGLAPFISIIRSELRRKREADVSRYVLLHGGSYGRDLGYRDGLLRLSRSNGLQYWATVSRPRECPDWKGDVGRVESYFGPANLAKLERRLGLPAGGFTPRTVAVFVCE